MAAATTVADRIVRVIRRFALPQGAAIAGSGAMGEAAVMTLLLPPSMSLGAYVQRLIDYMYCSPECFVIAAIYAMRMVTVGAVTLTKYTAHRVFGACLVLAVKARDDHHYKSSYYAHVLGVPKADLVLMEVFSLKALDFRTLVAPQDYAAMVQALVDVDAREQGNAWRNDLVVVPDSRDLVSKTASVS